MFSGAWAFGSAPFFLPMDINTLIILALIVVIAVSGCLLSAEGYYDVMTTSVNDLSHAKYGIIKITAGIGFFAISVWSLLVGLEIGIIALPLW